MHGNLSLDIICSPQIIVFFFQYSLLENCSLLRTDSFRRQISVLIVQQNVMTDLSQLSTRPRRLSFKRYSAVIFICPPATTTTIQQKINFISHYIICIVSHFGLPLQHLSDTLTFHWYPTYLPVGKVSAFAAFAAFANKGHNLATPVNAQSRKSHQAGNPILRLTSLPKFCLLLKWTGSP